MATHNYTEMVRIALEHFDGPAMEWRCGPKLRAADALAEAVRDATVDLRAIACIGSPDDLLRAIDPITDALAAYRAALDPPSAPGAA